VDGKRIEQYSEIPFYKHQVRVAMRNIGRIDPTDLVDAIAEGAYSGLARALFELTPDEVLDEVETSGQRGRGGAGFNTARKWRAPSGRRAIAASCCATATRATRARSRIAPSWRAIPTRCSRA
jgi:NADH:ubiquinone oxidoreductase subunit F (NADH-binding)